MAQLIEWRAITVAGSSSPLGFDETEGWSRFLTLDGERAYLIGGRCDTCEFMFERRGGANRNVEVKALASRLTQGIESLDTPLLDQIVPILPDGEYIAVLSRLTPAHVTPGTEADYFCHEQLQYWDLDPFSGLPHYPKTKYYRGASRKLDEQREFFEFVVPMFPETWLNEDRLPFYRELIAKGVVPTALAISVLEVRQHWNRKNSHWCLAHYLLDGHHKMYAANREGRPITLLSFIAVQHGMSSKEEVLALLRAMEEAIDHVSVDGDRR